MSSVLGSALRGLLDGLRAFGAPGVAMADRLAGLGYDVPPAAAEHVEAIRKALPTGLALGTDAGPDALLRQVSAFATALRDQPLALVQAEAGYAQHLADTLPERLLGTVAITTTQKAVPLVAGLLRMAGVFEITHVGDPAPTYEVPGPRYRVDLAQLRRLLKEPAAALRWGEVDFKSEAVVWGLADVLDAILGRRPAAEDGRLVLPPADEGALVGRVPATPSAAAAVEVGSRKIRLAGLHELGLVVVPATVSFTADLPAAVKQGITDTLGIDPDAADNPGLWIAPDKIGPLPHAAAILPGG